MERVDAAKARVAIEHKNSYLLYLDGGSEMLATLSGKLRHEVKSREQLPAVGDWVRIRGSVIEEVMPRKSQFIRKAAGENFEGQVVAANIDTVFVVSGLDHDFNLRRLERYHVAVRSGGAQCVILLNKADVCGDPDGQARKVRSAAPGADVVVLSALHDDVPGALRMYLVPDETVALVGSSGAGKSTLINRLLGSGHQTTREVRQSDSRGRHTTAHRQLFKMASGAFLIDTPGMRELGLWSNEESIEGTFPEIDALTENCRFRDCSHSGEDGCAVQAAADDGSLDAGRLESFRKMLKEAAHWERQLDMRARLEQKARWKKIHKAMRQMNKPA